MEHTRELHIVSGELNILKRTLYPLYNMVNALRDHHPTKRTGHLPATAGGRHTNMGNMGDVTTSEFLGKIRGANISDAAKFYLADVADHVLILTEEVDMLRGTVENMINMVFRSFLFSDEKIFNMVAATQGETMRQLTMVTLIFLPLTFLAGYFGMNFNQEYWHVLSNNGPIYFWEIAIPTTTFVTVVLTYSYLRRLMKTLSRQIVRKGVKVKLQKNREMRRHRGSISISRTDTMDEEPPPTHIHFQ